MYDQNLKILLNEIRNNFKIVIDDLVNVIEIVKDDVEKLKLDQNSKKDFLK
jgi:hypothetical protein